MFWLGASRRCSHRHRPCWRMSRAANCGGLRPPNSPAPQRRPICRPSPSPVCPISIPAYGSAWGRRVGTPRAIVDKLAGAVIEALHNEDVAKPLRAAGLDIRTKAPKEFAAYIDSETKKYSDVVAAAGLRK